MSMKCFFNYLLIVIGVILSTGCNNNRINDIGQFQIISEIKEDSESPFYVDFNNYPDKLKELPVGVFDSGTGGLTVLNSILKLDKFNNKTHKEGSDGVPDFISEKFIYLADEANMPYGKYEAEGKSNLLQEHIIKDLGFLLSDRYYNSPESQNPVNGKEQVKTVVIACNTATAFGLELLQNAKKTMGV